MTLRIWVTSFRWLARLHCISLRLLSRPGGLPASRAGDSKAMQAVPSSKPISDRSTGLRRALMAVPAVLAIGLALWLFVDRIAGAQMREPLTWDEILNLENYSWVTFNRNGLPAHADRVDDLLHVQRPNAMQFV